MVVPKSQYKEYLEDGKASQMENVITKPKISVMGDKATLRYVNGLAVQVKGTFDFVKQNESWIMTKWDWTYQGS